MQRRFRGWGAVKAKEEESGGCFVMRRRPDRHRIHYSPEHIESAPDQTFRTEGVYVVGLFDAMHRKSDSWSVFFRGYLDGSSGWVVLFFCGHIPNCPGSIFRAISLYTDLLFTTFIPTQSPWAGHLRTAALHCGLSKIEF